jgi:hypothetical protein
MMTGTAGTGIGCFKDIDVAWQVRSTSLVLGNTLHPAAFFYWLNRLQKAEAFEDHDERQSANWY